MTIIVTMPFENICSVLLSPTGNEGVRVKLKWGLYFLVFSIFLFCFSAWFCSSLNAFVHIIMYTYYALAAIPSMRGKLWWKKYITRLQLVRNSWLFICNKEAPNWMNIKHFLSGSQWIALHVLWRKSVVRNKNRSKRNISIAKICIPVLVMKDDLPTPECNV